MKNKNTNPFLDQFKDRIAPMDHNGNFGNDNINIDKSSINP
jgi:hypothetical protein